MTRPSGHPRRAAALLGRRAAGVAGRATAGAERGAITPPVFAAYAAHSCALNGAAVVFFRRAGVLAAVLVRLGYYLVWHVGYGNLLA